MDIEKIAREFNNEVYPKSVDGHSYFTYKYGVIASLEYISKIFVDGATKFLNSNGFVLVSIFKNDSATKTYGLKKTDKSSDYDKFLFENDEFKMTINLSYAKTEICYIVNCEKSKEIIETLISLRKQERDERTINLVTVSNGCYNLKEVTFNKQDVGIDDNYNEDLKAVHEAIIKHINCDTKSGVHLFYGIPGTGKSTYIRQLIDQTKRDSIFIPSTISTNLDSPDFIKLLIENPKSLLIIEDAEKVLKSREFDSNSPIASLLNISDGILGECLNIQIICTFNTDLSNIDKAVLRKGRLLTSYKFDALSLKKTKMLFNKLGYTNVPKEGMVLADIYNFSEETFHVKKEVKKIGFSKN